MSSVVVIGAGPVGLCLALALAKQGVDVTIIEQLAEKGFLNQVPRAGTNHPATLEMFDSVGLLDRLLPRGFIAPLFQYWDRPTQSIIAEFDHALLKEDTKFPFVLQCERIKVVEEALALVKADPRCTILMSTTYTGMSQSADKVFVEATAADGEALRIEADYLVSCEGARSILRREIGVEFEGFTYPERTLNIEVAFDFRKLGYTDRNYISDPDEYSNLFRWKGPPERWRVHFPTSPSDDEAEITRPEALQARLIGLFGPGEDYEVIGSNLYTVHQRVAASFRKGRAILAGDSAHVNSPIGGMGMNSGIHDAFNLAGKLGEVLLRGEDPDVLDRYDRQRRRIAVEHTQAQTIRNKRLLEEKDPAVRQKNHEELRRTSEDPVAARQFLLRTSLIDSVRKAATIQ